MSSILLPSGRAAVKRFQVSISLHARNVSRRAHTTPPSRRPHTAVQAQTGQCIPPPPVSTPFLHRLGPLTHAVRAYGRAHRRRPYVVQLGSALVIYACGDVSAQTIASSEEAHAWDPWSTLRAAAIGGIASIPVYRWFMFLGNSFNLTSRALSLGTKVVVNQIVFTPIFNSYFFASHALLSGHTPAQAWDRVQRAVPPSFVNSCKLWPAVTAINFSFIAPEYRSLFVGWISVGWQTYLSYMNQQAAKAARQ